MMSGLSEYAMNTERHKDIFSCFLDILQMSFDFILDLNKFMKGRLSLIAYRFIFHTKAQSGTTSSILHYDQSYSRGSCDYIQEYFTLILLKLNFQ